MDENPVELIKGRGGIVKSRSWGKKKGGGSAPKPKRFLAELAMNQAKALALLGQRKVVKKGDKK